MNDVLRLLMHFVDENFVFWFRFHSRYSVCNWQRAKIDLDGVGLAQSMRQPFIWTNVGLEYWHINSASLSQVFWLKMFHSRVSAVRAPSMVSGGREFESHRGWGIFHHIKIRLFQEQLSICRKSALFSLHGWHLTFENNISISPDQVS